MCLADQLQNLRVFSPGSRIVVFNGGTDRHLTDGLDVAVCPASQPLAHHRVGLFHGLVMRWLHDERTEFDLLVTLDSDMLLIKQGLEERLEAALSGADYSGAHPGVILSDTRWRPGQRFLAKWPGEWQGLFGIEHPRRSFNPGQVFSPSYVTAFATWEKRDRLLQMLAGTRLDALDEIVWATLGPALGLRTASHPGDRGLQLRRHAPVELADYLADPDVHLVHRVGMTVEALDRRLLRELRDGKSVDWSVPANYATDVARPSIPRRAAARGKDIYQRFAPQQRPST